MLSKIIFSFLISFCKPIYITAFFLMHFKAYLSPLFLFLTRNTLPNCPSPKLFYKFKSFMEMLDFFLLDLSGGIANIFFGAGFISLKISWFFRVASIRFRSRRLSIFFIGSRNTFPFPYFFKFDFKHIYLSELVAYKM